MTRFVLAIFSLLPLAFGLGCGHRNDNGDGGNTGNGDCTGDECGTDDTSVDPGDFSATLRSVAPYGWIGNHLMEPVDEDWGIACSSVNECDKPLEDYGNYSVAIDSDTFKCVSQVQLVEDRDDGSTVSVSDAWLGEGICGLAPDGEDDGWDVRTDTGDLNGDGNDEVIIHIASWAAIVTGSDFFYEDDEYLLEGWISEDLSQVYFHRVLETGETERTLDL